MRTRRPRGYWVVVAAAGILAAACSSGGTSDRAAGPDPGGSPRDQVRTTEPADEGDDTQVSEGATEGAKAPEGPGAVVVTNGVVLPVLEVRTDGTYLVQTLCGVEALATDADHIPYVDVVIDPGHGGEQPGAVGPTGLAEKVPNLEVSKLLVDELEAREISGLLTRTDDYRMSLVPRTQLAHSLRTRVFVSVHFNADPDEIRSTPGTETYYQHRVPESRRLAGIMYEEIYGLLSTYDIDWEADYDAGAKYRINDGGDDYYAVLRLVEPIPSVLTESLFISHAPEEALLRDADFQRRLAVVMAEGIERFLTTDDHGSGFVEPYHRDSPEPSGRSDDSCVDPDLGLQPIADPDQ